MVLELFSNRVFSKRLLEWKCFRLLTVRRCFCCVKCGWVSLKALGDAEMWKMFHNILHFSPHCYQTSDSHVNVSLLCMLCNVMSCHIFKIKCKTLSICRFNIYWVLRLSVTRCSVTTVYKPIIYLGINLYKGPFAWAAPALVERRYEHCWLYISRISEISPSS